MYSELSHHLTRTLSKDVKKQQGIFFTPPLTVLKTVESISSFSSSISSILEPSCGSCEFIKVLQRVYPTASITGIEYNETIYKSIQPLETERVQLIHDDFLSFRPSQTYDLIIGNPPFSVMKKQEVDSSYYPYFEGRPNLFILFIIKALSLLSDQGILSFILPKSFLNCIYYDRTRKYLSQHVEILHIMECHDEYLETQQETILFIARRSIPFQNKKWTFSIHESIIFGTVENMERLTYLYQDSTSLSKMGCRVYVGTIVWNQWKDQLSNDPSDTRLIYSSDIVKNQLVLKTYRNETKKNFIKKAGHRHPLLVVNRGYGIGQYQLQYCIIDGSEEYLIENHLICIEWTQGKNAISIYQQIIRSLEDPRTHEFIQLYFGNNAINTTELAHMFPIYHHLDK